MSWSTLAILCIGYDIITVPLGVFPLKENWFSLSCDWSIAIFWTLDIVVSFRTAYYKGCDLEERPSEIAKNYISSWLAPDLLITALGWFGLIAGATGTGSLLRVTRSMRAVRALRLVRLAKMMGITRIIEDHFNSLTARLCLVLVKLTIGLIMVIHIVACGWYWLGDITSGWVTYIAEPECGSAPDAEGMFARVPDAFKETAYLYFHSARWVLAQMNGRTDQDARRNLAEMVYTCVVAVAGPLVIMSVFVSSVTQNMMELSNITTETRANQMLLATYLTDKKISQELVTAMKMHARYHKDLEKQVKVEEDVMAILTKQMKRDLLYEVRAPTLVVHPLFHFINQDHSLMMLYLTAHSVQSLPVHKGEHVFEQGDASNHMLFSHRGRFMYGQKPEEECAPTYSSDGTNGASGAETLKPTTRGASESIRTNEVGQFESQLFKLKDIDNESVQDFEQGSWICEAGLWLEWRNRGTLLCQSEGCFFALEASSFVRALRNFPEMLALCASYARQFEEEHDNNPFLTDLIGIQISIGRNTDNVPKTLVPSTTPSFEDASGARKVMRPSPSFVGTKLKVCETSESAAGKMKILH